jgi:branched-chain amino acid transport system substrate-binding protein
MTAQLLRAKSGGAQAILIWAIGPELAAVANGKAKMGMAAPLIGGWTLSMSNFIDNAGKNGNGALMPQTFIEEPITPKAKAFIDAYHKAYGVNRIPSAVSAAQGYDAVYIFAAAVKQAGSADTHKIKAALEDLKEPVRGVIAIWKHPYSKWDMKDVESHEAFRRDHCVMGMVQDGKVVFAHDEDKQRLASLAKAP